MGLLAPEYKKILDDMALGFKLLASNGWGAMEFLLTQGPGIHTRQLAARARKGARKNDEPKIRYAFRVLAAAGIFNKDNHGYWLDEERYTILASLSQELSTPDALFALANSVSLYTLLRVWVRRSGANILDGLLAMQVSRLINIDDAPVTSELIQEVFGDCDRTLVLRRLTFARRHQVIGTLHKHGYHFYCDTTNLHRCQLDEPLLHNTGPVIGWTAAQYLLLLCKPVPGSTKMTELAHRRHKF